MNFGWLGNGSLFQEVTVRQRRGALILSTGCAVRALTADSCTSACIHPLKTAPFAPPLRTLATHNAGNTPANSWTGYAADLSDFRGQTIRLQFDLAGFQPAFPIYFCLDDVELWTDFVLSVPGSSS